MSSFLHTSVTGSLILSGSRATSILKLGEDSRDPVTDPVLGAYMWFDTDARKVKVLFTSGSGGGVWNTMPSVNVARFYTHGVGNCGNATLTNGTEVEANGSVTCTEYFNGVAWSTLTGSPACTRAGAIGGATDDFVLVAGTPANSMEYNGSTWGTGGSINTSRLASVGGGTSTAAAFIAGGRTPASCTCTEEYNGSSWTTVNPMLVCRDFTGATGTQNSALTAGGITTPTLTNTSAEYDGTSWTTGGNLGVTRGYMGVSGYQNAAVATGGATPTVAACTEEYNGSTWSTGTAKNVVIAAHGFSGKTAGGSHMTMGGSTASPFAAAACAEEYRTTLLIAGKGVWSAGAAMNVARYGLFGAGSQNAAFGAGGRVALNPVMNTCMEEYNGLVWNIAKNHTTARTEGGSAGTQNSGIIFGGRLPDLACTEEYDGFQWRVGGTMNVARYALSGAGLQDATLAIAGQVTPAISTCTEEYNGNIWSTGGAMSTARIFIGGAGSQNAGLGAGGQTPASSTATEEYSGLTWSAGGNLNTARSCLSGAGSQNAGLVFAGQPTSCACTEEYNGTAWSVGSALITGRSISASAGSRNAALALGGVVSSTVSCTEEYGCAKLVNVVCCLCMV